MIEAQHYGPDERPAEIPPHHARLTLDVPDEAILELLAMPPLQAITELGTMAYDLLADPRNQTQLDRGS